MTAPLGPHEAERLATLRRYGILDTEPEQTFEDLTFLASAICRVPIAAVTLVDEHRQWFKSVVGLPARQTSRDLSFCAHAILNNELLVVPDTLEDPRFASNPLVTSEPKIRFYAGAPLVTPDGLGLGTLCVVDTVPRVLTPFETEALQALSRQAMALIELGRQLRGRTTHLVDSLSERDRAEEELRASEERYRSVVESALDGVVSIDEESRILFANRAARAMFGYVDGDELVGREMTTLMPEASRREHEAGMKRSLAADKERASWQAIEMFGQRRDGSEFPVEISFSGSERRNGSRTFTGIIRDITERKVADNLRSALYRVAETTTGAEDLTKFYGAIHRIVGKLLCATNFEIALRGPAAGRLSFPYSVDERGPVPPDLSARTLTHHVLRSGAALLASQAEIEALAAAGEIDLPEHVPFEWLGVPLRSGENVFGVLAVKSYSEKMRFREPDKEILTFVSRHIASALEKKRVEEALAEWKDRYEAATLASGQILYDHDIRRNELTWGGDTLKVLGARPDELPSRISDWSELVHPDDREAFDAACARVPELDEPYHLEYRVGRRDGSYIFVRDDGTAIVDATGVHTRDVGFIVDITERKNLEDQLRHSQKMEAVGRLAGGVAHDFNNVLTAILGYSDLLLTQVDREDLRQNVEEIKRAGERAASLTSQLLAFSRKQILAPRVLDLNALVTDMHKMLRRVIGEDIHLVTHLAPDLGHVKADPGQIEHVIMNLAVNARDAMPGGGSLTIETANVSLGEEVAHEPSRADPHVLLAVTDTGSGMDAETRARLFEPFFTTKEQGKGTGLGLATSYGIVKQSGGEILVYSRPQEGTTIRIYLPRVDESIQRVPTGAYPALRLGGTETILLVEDEKAVGSLARKVLEANGYTVLLAEGAEEALRASEGHTGPLHLVLTDVVMPGLSGRELAHRIRAARPGIKVLYMSGYTDDAIVRHGVNETGTPFLQKPFSLEMLLTRVRESLATRQ